LFRDYGEAYISCYKPDLRTIKLIRSVRICRTPALGGKRFTCRSCSHEWYQYFSCGNSHCPLCQGNKRRAWYERLEDRLLLVPYVHITFTLPHELNGLCRRYPRVMYNMLLRTAWQTIRDLCATSIGGLPGMTAVLHTWGSDMKHHVHAHCLVTFGGLDEKRGTWHWPKTRDRLLGYRQINNAFRDRFLEELKKWMESPSPVPIYHQSYEVLTADLMKKSWVVNQQHPTADAEVINAYLSRYICRIGISDRRIKYDAASGKVELEYKDYRNQQAGQPAPLAYRQLSPLVAMQQLLQHLLPRHFHRSRSYGLHASATRKRLATSLVPWVQKEPDTVTIIFRLLKYLLLHPLPVCEQCGVIGLPLETQLASDRHFLATFLPINSRSPPGRGHFSGVGRGEKAA